MGQRLSNDKKYLRVGLNKGFQEPDRFALFIYKINASNESSYGVFYRKFTRVRGCLRRDCLDM